MTMLTKQGTWGPCRRDGGEGRNSLHPSQAKCDILRTSWKDQMSNGTILQRRDHVLQ